MRFWLRGLRASKQRISGICDSLSVFCFTEARTNESYNHQDERQARGAGNLQGSISASSRSTRPLRPQEEVAGYSAREIKFMDEKDTSRFDDGQKAPTPSPFQASNTLESLRPRDISWPTATLPGPGYAGAPADVPPDLDPYQTYDPVQKTDKFTGPEQSEKLNASVLPVDWPTAQETMGLPKLDPKKFEYSYKPTTTLEARISKLEGLVDGLLDRIALYNTRSSHKI